MASTIRFAKGHGLGNDYIVIDAAELSAPPDATWVRAVCDRHRGVGGDGLLLGQVGRRPVGLRIFNPDGTEAEKSGNGLRIFAAWLHGRGLVAGQPFEVALPAERVAMRVDGDAGDGSLDIEVDMGRPSFRPADVGFVAERSAGEGGGTGSGAGPGPEGGADGDAGTGGDAVAAGMERLPLDGGEAATVQPVSMGNPHCVVFTDDLRRDEFLRIAPQLARHPAFRAGTNVQFARVAGPAALEAWVWERGAGETLASGTSSCAVAAAALRHGRVAGPEIEIRMPGGTLAIAVGDDGRLRLRGPAQIVYGGELRGEVAAGWTAERAG